MDIAPILLALGAILTGLAGIAAVITAFSGRGKSRAEAAASLTNTATELIEPLRTELKSVRDDLTDARERLTTVEQKLRDEEQRSWSLVAYIRRLIDSHRRHAPDAPIPDPPTGISDII
jgi:chromosome segregation ATPase